MSTMVGDLHRSTKNFSSDTWRDTQLTSYTFGYADKWIQNSEVRPICFRQTPNLYDSLVSKFKTWKNELDW